MNWAILQIGRNAHTHTHTHTYMKGKELMASGEKAALCDGKTSYQGHMEREREREGEREREREEQEGHKTLNSWCT